MMFLMVSEVSRLQNALLPVLGYVIAAAGGAGVVFFLLMLVFRSDKSKNREEGGE